MTASLYQSGSSSAADGDEDAASIGRARLGASSAMVGRAGDSRPLQVKNVPLPHARIEPDVVPPSPPAVTGVVQQIVHRELFVVIADIGNLHPSMLHVVRIQ